MKFKTNLITAALFCAVATASFGVSAQTVRIANQCDSLSMDPHSLNESLQLSVTGNVYEALVGRNKDLSLAPALATERGEPLERPGEVPVGESRGVGASGAGKTTLLRALVGLLDVEAVEARVLAGVEERRLGSRLDNLHLTGWVATGMIAASRQFEQQMKMLQTAQEREQSATRLLGNS